MIFYYMWSYNYVTSFHKCYMQHLYSFMNKELFEAWWHWMQNLQMLSFILQVFSTPPHMFNNVNCIYYSTCCQTHYCRKTWCVVDLSLMTTIFILLLLKIIFFTKYRHMGVQEVEKIITSTHCCIHPHVEFCTS